MKRNIALMIPLLAASVQAGNIRKPNIIFVLVDDMGYGDVSALNEQCPFGTPHLDGMVRNGISFTDAHSCSAVSTPSRYGILTGRYNWRSNLKSQVYWGDETCLIPEGRSTMASMLKEKGYSTACIGKWHLGWDWPGIEKGKDSIDFEKPIGRGPTAVGFDYFYGICGSLDMAPYVYVENERPTAIPDHYTEGTGLGFWRKGLTAPDFVHEQVLPNFTQRAVNYIHQHAADRNPFFLYLPLPSPHTPILPTKDWEGRSGVGAYGDFVMMTDAMMGQVLQALADCGIEENTLVVFTSDNGCSPAADFKTLKEKGHNPSYIFRGMKSDLYEGGHRIPCLLQWKGHTKPGKVEQTICLTDFFATFADLNGIKLKDNEGEDSYSLKTLLRRPDSKKIVREATVHHSYDGDFSIRQGNWKLVVTPTSGGWSYPMAEDVKKGGFPLLQLYDIKNDIGEKQNIVAKHKSVALQLLKLLQVYVTAGRSTPGTKQANDGEGRWKELEKVFKDYPELADE